MRLLVNSLFIGLVLISSYPAYPHENKSIQSHDIEILESIAVDSVPADFPVSFSFLTKDDWQFIAYYNKHRYLSVASRKVSESKWNYKILPTKVGWDSHNRIVMTFDREFCIHVSGNMHNDSMTYFKTGKPFDISTFEKVFPLVAEEDELSCTYPGFLKTPDNQVIYSYRKGGSGNGITITSVYDEKSRFFTRLSDKPLFDGLGQMSAYASGPRLGNDGLYHLAWLWRDTPHCETNHDLSYARSKDLKTWETIGGIKLELPITPRLNQFTVDPVPPLGGAINGAYRLFFNRDNVPLLAYMKYDQRGNNQLFVAKAVDGTWSIKQVTNWKYRWEFKGPGSITFEIIIKNVFETKDNNINIDYWHIKRGDGKLIIDPNTLTMIEDRAVQVAQKPVYPKQLLDPQRAETGMTVHWQKARSADHHNSCPYYLRWETMGKRRFYKPPETPVKPSALILYKLSETE